MYRARLFMLIFFVTLRTFCADIISFRRRVCYQLREYRQGICEQAFRLNDKIFGERVNDKAIAA